MPGVCEYPGISWLRRIVCHAIESCGQFSNRGGFFMDALSFNCLGGMALGGCNRNLAHLPRGTLSYGCVGGMGIRNSLGNCHGGDLAEKPMVSSKSVVDLVRMGMTRFAGLGPGRQLIEIAMPVICMGTSRLKLNGQMVDAKFCRNSFPDCL